MYRCSKRLLPVLTETSLTRSKKTMIDPFDIHERILYSDDRLVVYNKGMKRAVHGGHKVGKTLMQQFEECNLLPIYPVHRLDKGTTGVIMFARDKAMASFLSHLLRHGKLLRSYLALCIGVPRPLKGEVSGMIGMYYKNNRYTLGMTKRQTNNTKQTCTKYRTVKSYSDALSIVEFQPISGAKHQLKIHAAQILKTPIFGDLRYAPKALLHNDLARRYLKTTLGYNHLHLHAQRVLIPDYNVSSDLVVEAPLPPTFLNSICKVEMYHFHRIQTLPKPDKQLDFVEDRMLEKMTGINPAASEYEIDATVREEDASVVPDLSYYDEHIYSKYDPYLKRQDIRTNIMWRNTLKPERKTRR